MLPIKTAVIGVGYLGKFHAQKYVHLKQSQLIGVCDTDAKQAKIIAEQCGTQAFSNYRELVNRVDAVTIATPTPLHFDIAKYFLMHGIHVLVEKPITTTLEQADELIQIAKEHNAILQVGHLERFNNVIIEGAPDIHSPHLIECLRLAPFQLRGTDVNVVLDLMIHDIDLIQYLVGSPIEHIAANGASIVTPFMDIANARVEFKNGCVATISASRVSMHRERNIRVFQSHGYITLDLDKKIIAKHRKGYSKTQPNLPEIVTETRCCEQGDPLMEQAKAFLHAIATRTAPIVSGTDGKNALRTAIEITKQLHINREKREQQLRIPELV